MFEEYLFDSDDFLTKARGSKSHNEVMARRYYRASIFFTASAMEAYINYIAESFDFADSLSLFEIAFLTDKKIQYSVDNLDIEKRTEYHKIDEKSKVLIKKFVSGYDFNNVEWSNFHEFKQFRDTLVHPRMSEDIIPIVNMIKCLLRD